MGEIPVVAVVEIIFGDLFYPCPADQLQRLLTAEGGFETETLIDSLQGRAAAIQGLNLFDSLSPEEVYSESSHDLKHLPVISPRQDVNDSSAITILQLHGMQNQIATDLIVSPGDEREKSLGEMLRRQHLEIAVGVCKIPVVGIMKELWRDVIFSLPRLHLHRPLGAEAMAEAISLESLL